MAWLAVSSPGVAAWAVLLGMLLLLLWAYRAFLGYCEERFRAVYGVGLLLMAVTLGSMAWGAATHDVPGTGERMVAGVMRAVEVLLLMQLSGWVLMALLVTAAVALGEWACTGKQDSLERRQSIVTARLGLFVSMGIFVAFVMTVWALVSQPLDSLVTGLHYAPWWFQDMTLNGQMQTNRFLALRFNASTDTFAVVAIMLLTLLGYVALIYLPSVLVELRIAGWPRAARLGHWLTAGYRALDRLVRWWSWLIALALVGVAVLLVGSQLARLNISLPWLGLVALPMGTWSGDLLARLVVTIAGGAVGLVAVGGMAFKQLKAVRAPLDAALDVDNHFREFPRKAIPRVMIIERYVAVLEQVLSQGYERIVIVSHSQGTVITADLLRYLQRRHRLKPANAATDRLVQLGQRLAAKNIRLLTAGSPLRQLYALRFPCQYDWVLGPIGVPNATTGPDPRGDLGVAHWVNVWGAGDYVGRWLWTQARDPTIPALAVDPQAYEGKPTQRVPDYRDLCLGADAHTHYFDLDNKVMLDELRALV
jgi:Ca2+/Na+ antiporter